MMEDKKVNIKVAPDSDNVAPAHQMATDGNQTVDIEQQQKKESRAMQKEALMFHMDNLRKKEVKCAYIDQEGKKPCLAGKYKGHPFVVYLKIYREGTEWAAILVTRYKGADHEMRPPYEVLCAT